MMHYSLYTELNRLPRRFSNKEKSVLQVIIEESLTNFIFDGIKRKTGMHQETLSRTLARLEHAGIITKTSEGYVVADNAKEHFPIPLGYSSSSIHVPLIQTMLPQDVDLECILSGLQGKWFGTLRWFGRSKTESNITLKWLTEDGKVQIEALFSDSSLSIEGKLQNNKDLSNAIKASHQLMEQIIKLYSKQKNAIL
jgi:DNA-binding transcriptional ArsR family regulator